MRIVSLGLVVLLLAAAVAPAALRAQAANPGTAPGGGAGLDRSAAPATWSPGEVTTTAACDIPGCTDGGGSIDPDGLTAPATWSPSEVTTTTACDVVGCAERGGDIDPLGLSGSSDAGADTDPNGLPTPSLEPGFLDLWIGWLRALFSF